MAEGIVIKISVKSSDARAALGHLHQMRYSTDDGGIKIMISKIEEGLNAIHESGNGE